MLFFCPTRTPPAPTPHPTFYTLSPLPQSLLEKRLQQEEESVSGCAPLLLNQVQVVSTGCDLITLQLLRIRALAGVSWLGSRRVGAGFILLFLFRKTANFWHR